MAETGEGQSIQEEEKALTQKTREFFKEHRTGISIGAVAASPTAVLIAYRPLEGLIMAGAAVGAAIFLDRLDRTEKKNS